MYKRILSLILCMCLVITSCSNQKTSQDINDTIIM